jgi:hypothetical protein
VGDRDGLGEVGVDDDPVQVADDEEGRIGEGIAVEQKLIVGGSQVLVLALLFPAEEVLFPDIGEAVAPAMLFRPLFEAEGVAVGSASAGVGVPASAEARSVPGRQSVPSARLCAISR